ncbi:hypothetical protein ACIPSA_31645 [Streptomyces sp. NPDC086549]|uniref:hypothetical protein n=1 Tax=Streptomyces sp. NPDC086549 TaxID=3365752 RepID=UPI00381EA3A9
MAPRPAGTAGARRGGATQYTPSVDHTFQNRGCYWAVQAATHSALPAAPPAPAPRVGARADMPCPR